MEKEIYIIKNNINDKVYIGQSVDSKVRWRQHISNAKTKNSWSAVDIAIGEYGVEHFYYEIIEKTEDYDNREAYWIEYYNSLYPNGYNYVFGSEGCKNGVAAPNSKIRDEKILDEIIDLLKNSSLSQIDIASKYNMDKRIISAINRGTAYKKKDIDYPIRKKIQDIGDKERKNIYNELYKNKLSIKQIAKKYNYSINSIEKIKYEYENSL